jgi:hypothetical protein
MGNVLSESKHIMEQATNYTALAVMAYVRRAVLTDEWIRNRDTLLSAYSPLGADGQVALEVDEYGVYCEVQDEEGRGLGWVSLDEDEGGDCPLAGAGPSDVTSLLARFARVGFAQIFDRREQRPVDWRMLQLV